MGCHAWFARPMTDEEFKVMREAASDTIELFFGGIDSEFDFSKDLAWCDAMLESVKTNTPYKTMYSKIIRNHYWFQFGYGEDAIIPQVSDISYLSDSDDISTEFVYDKKANLYGAPYRGYIEIKMHNVARLRFTYPKIIIHNKRELRRYLRKDYFKISEEEHEKLSQFWSHFPGGIMRFG